MDLKSAIAIADLTRMEENVRGDCSQDIVASWGLRPQGTCLIQGGGEVKKGDEEHLPENREQGKGVEVDTDRLLGSSWIADLTH